jgi:23S rRNA (adenine1618-N6)-methyltransferase
MHKRNLHKDGYDFDTLVFTQPTLAKFVVINPNGRKTIDFANPNSIKELNGALLKHYYGITHWNIPHGYLCPPIPGRADYIHAIADLLAENPRHNKATKIKGLDIGTGANLIYPIIGSQSYGWQFVATDIDKTAVKSAKIIQSSNGVLRNVVKIRHQANPKKIFDSVIKSTDLFDFCMCNPPFHVSKEAALLGSVKKNENLKRNQSKRHAMLKQKLAPTKPIGKNPLNFEGQNNELWCDGGEVGFIQRMITESIDYQKQIKWFTTLVSKKESLKIIYKKLNEINVTELKTINMTQGSKSSRFIAWRF